jgi:O-antigen ligase
VLSLIAGAALLPVFFLPLTPQDPFLLPKQSLLSFIACIALITLFYPVERLFRDSSKTLLISSLIFLSSIAISIPASTNQQAGVSELMRWAYLLIIFFTATRVDWDVNRLRKFIKLSLIVSAIVSISTLLEYFKLVPFYLYPFHGGRTLYSFFGYTNIIAQYLIVTIFWGIGLTLSSETRRTKVAALLCTLLSLGAMFVTFTRGANISIITGGLLFSYLFFKTRGTDNTDKRKVKLALVLIIAALIAGVLIANKVTDGRSFTQLVSMLERDDSSRLMLAKKTFNVFSLNPVSGVGLGNYRFVKHIYVHNEILQMLGETGVVGLGGFLVFLFFVLKMVRQQYVNVRNGELKVMHMGIISGIFATMTQSMVSFNLHSAASSFFFFLGFGILCANRLPDKQRKLLTGGTIINNIITLFIALSLSLWAMHGEYKRLLSHYYFSQAILFQTKEEISKSLEYSLKAIQYQPYNSKYHRFAGRIYLERDQLELAKKYFKKAGNLSLYK